MGNIGGGLWKGVKDIGGAVGNTLGVLGGDYEKNKFKAKEYKPDEEAYKIEDSTWGMRQHAIGEAASREAPEMQAANAGQVGIDQAQQAQFRQGQSALGQQLAARAAGTAPSAAEMQQRQGLDAAIMAQRSAAASARGVSPGMAQRMAAQGTAQAQGQAVRDASILRANEQANAEQALGQHLASARGQDIGLATSQAGLAQQTNLANAGFQQGAAQNNQQAILANSAQTDSVMQSYIAMGMSREQAQQQALADLEALKSGNRNATNSVNAGVGAGDAAAANQAQGGALSAAGTIVGAYAKSDKRAKEDIKDGRQASKEFLDGLRSYTFKYKDSSDGEGEHLGVMAQDVEKLPGGKGMVIETTGGKMLHAGQGVGRLLAAAAELNRRVNKLEARR
jgi:hypothetical protein